MKKARTKLRRALFVLGMHRSGTSAVTRVINLLGAELGSDLIPPAPDNPQGFWEHAEAVRINDDLLQGLGRTWYDMREMQEGWVDSPSAKFALQRIEKLIERDFATSSLCAIKDPRMCLTAPLWIKGFELAGFEVDCLFVVRDPREIVESLHRRNDWPRAPLYLMWVQYLMAAAAASNHRRRAVLTYDQLLSDWHGNLARVARELCFSWPIASVDSAAQAVDAFLDPGQRHHQESSSQVGGTDAPIPGLVRMLYQTYLEIAAGKNKWGAISAVRHSFCETATLYAARVDHLLTERWSVESRAQTAETHLEEQVSVATVVRDSVQELQGGLETRLAALERSMADVAQTAVARNAEQASATTAVRDSVQELQGGLEARLGALEQSVADVAQTAVARNAEYASAFAAVRDSVQQLQGGLEARLDALEQIVMNIAQHTQAAADEMSAGSDEIAARFERQRASLLTVEARIQRQDTRLNTILLRLEQSGSDRLAERLDAIDALLRAESHKLQSALAGSNATITALTASTSWKLTAPIRWLSVHVLRRPPPSIEPVVPPSAVPGSK